jgi:hypothetical protein
MVYVRTSTLNAIVETVDQNSGAAVIQNCWVRDREGKDRLRLTRLQAVRSLLVRRGLRTFPDHLLYSDENWSFVAYRPELLIVDVGVVVSNPDKRDALDYVMRALNKSASDQFIESKHRFRSMLLQLPTAHPEISWKFRQSGAAV